MYRKELTFKKNVKKSKAEAQELILLGGALGGTFSAPTDTGLMR